MTQVATWWNNVPASIRDFVEAAIAAAIGGAATGVLALSLDQVTAKQVAYVALTGAIASLIAFARHRLAAA